MATTCKSCEGITYSIVRTTYTVVSVKLPVGDYIHCKKCKQFSMRNTRYVKKVLSKLII